VLRCRQIAMNETARSDMRKTGHPSLWCATSAMGRRMIRARSTSIAIQVLCIWFIYRTVGKAPPTRKSTFCQGEWLGNFVENRSRVPCAYHVVVSHCTANLTWLVHELRALPCNLKSLTIYSKCQADPVIVSKISSTVKTSYLTLPNVGRCDHTYAHHMAALVQYRAIKTENDVFVFLKDTRVIHQPGIRRALPEMILMARGPARFSCGLIPKASKDFRYADISVWHKTAILGKFRLNKYTRNADIYTQNNNPGYFTYRLGDFRFWANSVGVKLSNNDVTPVCYGGNFATLGSQIKLGEIFWPRIEHALRTGNNIEEGHFMERLWAHLLVQRSALSADQILLRHARGAISKEYKGLCGTLYGCRL